MVQTTSGRRLELGLTSLDTRLDTWTAWMVCHV